MRGWGGVRPEKTSGRGSEGLISHRPLQVTIQITLQKRKLRQSKVIPTVT